LAHRAFCQAVAPSALPRRGFLRVQKLAALRDLLALLRLPALPAP